MILDTSAIVAVLFDEPDRDELRGKIDEATGVGVGAPTLFETEIVLVGRIGDSGRTLLKTFVESSDVGVVPFEEMHYRAAADAWMRFGRGRHPAKLNLGDCLSYAVAKVAEEPLLCKGGDFAKTDVALA